MAENVPPKKSLMDRIKGALPRLSAPLSEDGARFAVPKTEKVREQLRDVIKNTLADKDTAAALGLTPAPAADAPAAPAAPGLDSLGLAHGALELVSAMATKYALRAGYSENVARHAGLDQHDRELLAPSGARLIDKWAPATFSKWGEEIDFGSKVLHVLMEKVRLMRELAAKEPPPAVSSVPAGTGRDVLPFTSPGA